MSADGPDESTESERVEVLEKALVYVDLGWEAVPLPLGKKAPVPAGSALGGKVTGKDHTPMSHADLADYILVRSWTAKATGERLPYGNLGLVMPPGVVGLDVDAYDGKPGAQSLQQLNELCGGLPETFSTTSRTDGIAGIYFFRCDEADELADIPGIDVIRPTHRYALVSPSVHPEGGRYTWRFGGQIVYDEPNVGDLPLLPLTVRDFLRPSQPKDGAGNLEVTKPRHTSARVDGFLEALDSGGASETRHSAMRDFIAHLVATGQDSDAMITLARREWHRNLPERSHEFESALHGARANFAPPTIGTGDLAEVMAGSRLDLARLLIEGAPDPEWLIEPLIPAKRTTLITAGAKTGKSLLLGEAVFAAALGRAFLGETPDRPIKTLYLDYEMTESDIAERLDSMGYGPADGEALAENLAYYQHPPLGPLDTANGAAGLLGLADIHDPDLIVIDTWSRVISGNENDSEPCLAFYRHTLSPLKARKIAVVLADHTGHENKNRSRGSSAKLDLVDLAWTIKTTDGGIDLKRQAQRISWAQELVSIKRIDDGHPIHRRTAGGWPAGTRQCADTLERLAIPRDLGERKARVAVKEAGEVAPKSEVLRAAIKLRRQEAFGQGRGSDAPADAPLSSPSDAPSDAAA